MWSYRTLRYEVKIVKLIWIISTVAGVLLCGGVDVKAAAQTPPPAADNTKANKAVVKKGQPTADQAKNSAADLDIMQKIRKAVMDDKSLSSYAHNVKVISQNQKVTLKGPVRSNEEKKNIEQKATDVVGAGNVTNQITIRAAAPKKTN
jgi:hyperosmotically inducible protein